VESRSDIFSLTCVLTMPDRHRLTRATACRPIRLAIRLATAAAAVVTWPFRIR
jgi:hypothetical protein